MSNQIDSWGREYTDAEQARHEIRESGFTGWVDKDGQAVMSRTDPRTGRALGFESRGFSGKGTTDEGFAARWGRKHGKR